MRRIGIIGDLSKRFLRFFYKSFIFTVSFFLISTTTSWAADKIAKIEVFPPTPYDGYIIYESLAVFWLFIISLIVIIRMKLREIERIQELGVEEEDPDAPMLR